jgi:hypothetical protein
MLLTLGGGRHDTVLASKETRSVVKTESDSVVVRGQPAAVQNGC